MAAYPSSYPSYRFYEDGRSVVVQNQAECDALAPGHAGSPAGPFPAVTGETETAETAETARDSQEARRHQVHALREQGLTQQAIADQLGLTRHQVQRLLQEP